MASEKIAAMIEEIQADVDKRWNELMELAGLNK